MVKFIVMLLVEARIEKERKHNNGCVFKMLVQTLLTLKIIYFTNYKDYTYNKRRVVTKCYYYLVYRVQ